MLNIISLIYKDHSFLCLPRAMRILITKIVIGHAVFRISKGKWNVGGKRLRVLLARAAQFQIKFHIHDRAA